METGTPHPDLIYDWNSELLPPKLAPNRRVELDDETLRDGLQSPSITDPVLGDKLGIVHLMEALGIDACDIGLPGASPKAHETCVAIAKEIGDQRLRIRPNCAVRTTRADIDPLIDISMKVGYPVEAAMFIGSSPIRFYAEGWTLDKVRGMTEDAVSYAVKNGIPVMYVTEDTTRTDPASIKELFQTAIRAGAYRVCIADTVGHANPPGVSALVRFVREVVAETGTDTKIDWHGHSDRGLAIPNAMQAIYEGVDRVHGTGLGIGERCGNTQMDQLLINLRLDGWTDRDLSYLYDYCLAVSKATGIPIPANYPAVGRDAFRTSTGVHAAAIVKAMNRNEPWLVDAVYSGVPANMIGRRQEIEIGFMSGASNVSFYLRQRGIEPTEELVGKILAAAKAKREILSEEEIVSLCGE
ncbi:MAG: 2-isopropylmalate synthase [Candidatus Eisenbacteria bacterium]|uniref:2-isopropylmalate synthase n=1 Tax=Eiseniibacteriota bacterium TaxID=2212470 RepID=A0A956SE69_UNCEI|nr:2-isopropylmalate synthase [Candidatus Eisenbacteria bacterium]MCB9462468.1 2-isopropylmalate synthase [Candidatus Eisenbacteria bacterium]